MIKDTFELPENLKQNSREKWRAGVEKNLNGQSIETSLGYKTYDGIEIKPLYDHEDGSGKNYSPILVPDNVGTSNGVSGQRPWEPLQLIDIPSLKQANQQMITDLKGGASGFVLSVSSDIPYGAGVLPLLTLDDFSTLFEDIELQGTSLYFTNGREGLSSAAGLLTYLGDCDGALETIKGSFGFDPISQFGANGVYPDPEDEALANWVDAAFAIQASKIGMSSFMASGRFWQQAGASAAMELAFTLAASLTYVRALQQAGFTNEDAFASVDMSLVVTSDFFLSSAKLRAMRLLWDKVCRASGQAPVTKVIAEMSYLDLTNCDCEVNMLRATAGTVAAGLGNVDGLVLLPFSTAFGVAPPSARRLALNTQLIAQEESYIGLVEDPCAGAWYMESLTDELCAKAWDLFCQTEREGGIGSMLRDGKIKDLIEPLRALQERDLAVGKKEITGVTLFPNLHEEVPAIWELGEDQGRFVSANDEDDLYDPIDLIGPQNGERFEALQECLKNGVALNALDNALEGPSSLMNMTGALDLSLVSSFEGLRSTSDYMKVEQGHRPRVFLANLGTASDFTARSGWAKSYFEAGGIEAVGHSGGDNLNEIVTAFSHSGAHIVCLCSSDARYLEEAIAMAKSLKAAGARAVYMVAKPKLLKSLPYEGRAEIHGLIYQGSNRVLTLMEAYYIIGFDDEIQSV